MRYRFLAQLYEELFPLEGNLDDFRPGKRVDLDIILEDDESR